MAFSIVFFWITAAVCPLGFMKKHLQQQLQLLQNAAAGVLDRNQKIRARHTCCKILTLAAAHSSNRFQNLAACPQITLWLWAPQIYLLQACITINLAGLLDFWA